MAKKPISLKDLRIVDYKPGATDQENRNAKKRKGDLDRGLNDDVNHYVARVDEISKKKVDAYLDASHNDFKKQQGSGKPMTPKQKKRHAADSKAYNMAYNKLTGRGKVNATEEVDQLDEVAKTNLDDYYMDVAKAFKKENPKLKLSGLGWTKKGMIAVKDMNGDEWEYNPRTRKLTLMTEATINIGDVEKNKRISDSDKDKLSKVADMMRKEKEARTKKVAEVTISPLQKESVQIELEEKAPKMRDDYVAVQRKKDADHAKAMGRSVKTGRKLPTKTMTSTQRSLASIRNEATISPLQKIRMDKEKADRNKDNNAKTQAKRITDKQYAGYKVKMKEEVEELEERKNKFSNMTSKSKSKDDGAERFAIINDNDDIEVYNNNTQKLIRKVRMSHRQVAIRRLEQAGFEVSLDTFKGRQIWYKSTEGGVRFSDVDRALEEANEEWKKDSGWKKPEAVRKDKFGNIIKTKNVAKNLAKASAKKSAEMSKEEDMVYKKEPKKGYDKVDESINNDGWCAICGNEPCTCVDTQTEALDIRQRRKRSISAKKNKSKLAMGRKRASRRVADMDKLRKRSRRAARNQLVQKLLKNVPKDELSPARKQEIEKRVDKLGPRIDRIAKKLLPSIRQAEVQRKKG